MTSNTVAARSALPSLARPSLALRYLAIGALLAACGRERMSLGSNEAEPTPEINPCGDGIVQGLVQVAVQRDLDALLGCEVIDGDLRILQPPDSAQRLDLAPLHTLRQVNGTLTLEGVYSLAGLDSLEQVASLELLHIASEDLSALAQLERVVSDPPDLGTGTISISNCENLRSLNGLERLSAWTTLRVNDDPVLETLSGLAGPSRLEALSLSALPSLRDLRGLEFARFISFVDVSATAIETLEGLGLMQADYLTILGNEELSSLSGLRKLGSVGTFLVQGNDRLLTVAPPQLSRVETFSIIGNDSLTEVRPRGGNSGSVLDVTMDPLNSSNITLATDVFEVRNNAHLTQVELPGGLTKVQQVSIWGNPALSDLALDHLQRADGLYIVDNPSLKTFYAPDLERVGDLQVVNNPQFSTSALDNVQTFTRSMSGNAEPAAP